MSNLFFRTNIAPYRIDTYNALHKQLGCEMYFYWKKETSQNLDMEIMLRQCNFIPHHLKGIKLGANSRKFCTQIWSILRKNNPDIVIVPEYQIMTIQILLYRWIFRKKFKVVSMCDDSYNMVANKDDFSRIHRIARNFIVPRLDNLLLADKRVVEWYQQHYRKGIWLPIIRDEKKEIEEYRKVLPTSNKFNERFNLKGKKVLLFVGRLVGLKNIDGLIDAISKTKEDFVTVIVGSGEEKERLQQLADASNKSIIFAGHYEGEELKAWYNISDVLVLPSYKEAFGAVTNEALIAGNYCLVSKLAGSACLINKNNGKIIDPHNIEDMARDIDWIFSNKIPPKNNNIVLKGNKMDTEFESVISRAFDQIKL